ncbi:MAG TPA: ABC transporter substrate binding protein [Rhodocyclaceae bacterium]|nr:ABC transporter substrate binding protein [Rhodocyclaceae bacterium]
MGCTIRRFLLILLTLAGLASPARAALVALVSADEGAAFSEAADAISAELRGAGHRVQSFTLPLRADDTGFASAALIVTLGSRAAQLVSTLPLHGPVLHTLLPRSAFDRLPRPDDPRRVSAVYIDQPAGRQLELIRQALPDWQRLAVITGRDSAELGTRLQAAAREHRSLRVQTDIALGERDIYPVLQRMLAEPAILVAVPDATLFNSNTISNILLTAYHHRSPVVGFSAAYIKAGALLALYSTPAQIGQQAGEVARQALASGTLPPPQYPRQFRVGTNAYVARSLGITLEDPNALRDRLERTEGTP